jgi:hypothetical protein
MYVMKLKSKRSNEEDGGRRGMEKGERKRREGKMEGKEAGEGGGTEKREPRARARDAALAGSLVSHVLYFWLLLPPLPVSRCSHCPHLRSAARTRYYPSFSTHKSLADAEQTESLYEGRSVQTQYTHSHQQSL